MLDDPKLQKAYTLFIEVDGTFVPKRPYGFKFKTDNGDSLIQKFVQGTQSFTIVLLLKLLIQLPKKIFLVFLDSLKRRTSQRRRRKKKNNSEANGEDENG